MCQKNPDQHNVNISFLCVIILFALNLFTLGTVLLMTHNSPSLSLSYILKCKIVKSGSLSTQRHFLFVWVKIVLTMIGEVLGGVDFILTNCGILVLAEFILTLTGGV